MTRFILDHDAGAMVVNDLPGHNRRKPFTEAVDYAIQVTEVYLRRFRDKGIDLDGLDYFEAGPGADFAPQLVLASHGANVTIADKYLAAWDERYHPRFYSEFLQRWHGPADAIGKALEHGGYDPVIRLVPEALEDLASVAAGSFDFVQSNAALEHVLDIHQAVSELARITVPGGVHVHQVDFRFHTDFEHPLDHLLLTQDEYRALRSMDDGQSGTDMRMPELIEILTRYFWLFEMEVNGQASPEYVNSVKQRLPDDSPYKAWPAPALRQTGVLLWLARKEVPLTREQAAVPASQDPAARRWPRLLDRCFVAALLAMIRWRAGNRSFTRR